MILAHFDGLATCEGLQGVRQLACPWQPCFIDQHRNNTNVTRKCCRDFDGYKIVSLVDATPISVVPCVEPLRADDDEQHVAGRHLLIQMRNKVDASRNVVYVHENLLAA